MLVNPSPEDIRKLVDDRVSEAAGTDERRAKALRTSRPTLDRWRAAGDSLKIGVLRKLAEVTGRPVVVRFDPPPDNERKAPRPEWAEGLEARLDMVLWALRVSPEEQADLLTRRAEGETWPPRDNDGAPAGGAGQSANAP